jgi:hypothetical protein
MLTIVILAFAKTLLSMLSPEMVFDENTDNESLFASAKASEPQKDTAATNKSAQTVFLNNLNFPSRLTVFLPRLRAAIGNFP